MPEIDLETTIRAAAAEILRADALLVGAGAGMGVDSGLPDFRGDQGFWRAYPPFRGRRFSDISNPEWFFRDPALAWGFFGHRYLLYREATPHAGFSVLRRWAAARSLGTFVFTSNVDGQFQKAGFSAEQIVEAHGSIFHWQCARQCTAAIWEAADWRPQIDAATIRCLSEFPKCPHCGGVARPNILMFGDGEWQCDRADVQHGRYTAWLARCAGKRLVAVELGAGLAIPTVRYECQSQASCLIRINPREAETPQEGISLPLPAADALARIDQVLAQLERTS